MPCTEPSASDGADIDLTLDAEPWGAEAAHMELGASPASSVTLCDLTIVASRPVEAGRTQSDLGVSGKGGAAAGAPVRSTTSMCDATVANLVAKAGEGCPRAWEELVARFGGMIAATGRRYRLSAPDVAELQQTTWLRLLENLHRIEQPERVGGWLATTARRESLQLLKRASRYHSGADQMLANMPDRHLPDPDSRPIAQEVEAVVRRAWARLNPRSQRLLSLLVTDEPMGYKDLSRLLQMPVGSIGPTRARCLEKLRRLVAEEGLSGL